MQHQGFDSEKTIATICKSLHNFMIAKHKEKFSLGIKDDGSFPLKQLRCFCFKNKVKLLYKKVYGKTRSTKVWINHFSNSCLQFIMLTLTSKASMMRRNFKHRNLDLGFTQTLVYEFAQTWQFDWNDIFLRNARLITLSAELRSFWRQKYLSAEKLKFIFDFRP